MQDTILLADKTRFNDESGVLEYFNGEQWLTASRGTSPNQPATSCREIKDIYPSHKSGVYWIKPSANYPPMQVLYAI